TVFEAMGEGVRRSFEAKVRELEGMERRRADLATELAAAGKTDAVSMLNAERDRIRGLTRNLAEASLLIIRKLRHALEALEVLASDGASQRGVLETLRGDVGIYRKVWEFSRDMNELQRDIDNLTRTAVNFDNLLRDNLGPLGVLVDEIAKVDGRVAESLAEIQALSERLEKNQALGPSRISLGGNILDVLTGVRVKADQVAAILERLGSDADAPFDGFDLDLAEGSDLDFHALAENMSALVDQGFRRLAGLEPEPSAPAQQPGIPAAPTTAETLATETPAAAPAEAETSAAAPVSPDAIPAWAKAAQGAVRGETSRPGNLSRRHDGSAYRAAISRTDPTLIVFLLDRSGSMDTPYALGQSRVQYLARTVDHALYELAVRCTRTDGVRDYFHVACLGYGDGTVSSALPEGLGGSEWTPISRIAGAPARLEDLPSGGKEPRWIDPVAEGDTPMTAAFEAACRLAARWCDAHPRSYPPTVINVSDGEPTDGDPRPAAKVLGSLHTDDGEVLVFNLHVGSGGGEVAFPSEDSRLDQHGRLLFSMSSRFTPHLLALAADSGLSAGPESRFFAFGAGADLATRFLELGSRSASLR
ncbi:MAG TPA: hypothetical protein VLH39_01375, partial [Magnetospirillaceae bacterium]|nr:hypothetical protein [Magnetospirillaceae bacterium]